MNVATGRSGGAGPETLASEWYEGFQREAVVEAGDPEAYISHLRELADGAEPGSSTHLAFGVFLERLREDELDQATEE